jgi:mannosyltransferase
MSWGEPASKAAQQERPECLPIVPGGSRPNAAVMYLLAVGRTNEFKQSLESLKSNYLLAFPYPVIVFYEEENGPALASVMKETLEIWNDTTFEPITLSFPDDFDGPKVNNDTKYSSIPFYDRYPGYQHMIRFWFRSVFEHPRVRKLDYYLRLDTDSFILAPVTYDLFKFMRAHSLHYGYRAGTKDPSWVLGGLSEFVESYVNSNGVKPLNGFTAYSTPGADGPTYYNNFEVSF